MLYLIKVEETITMTDWNRRPLAKVVSVEIAKKFKSGPAGMFAAPFHAFKRVATQNPALYWSGNRMSLEAGLAYILYVISKYASWLKIYSFNLVHIEIWTRSALSYLGTLRATNFDTLAHMSFSF